ncbi:heavy-metal-associated domain-containing protein [Caenispirillum salinarum]|uniref:heavy-metal-associated domain-containing protein n=1 Tax=Caenispirillum salinarum TaxID=859058 RepID=UPI0038503B59
MSKTYSVAGMTCGGCARSVEQAIKGLKEDAVVSVDVSTGQVTVENGPDDAAVEKAVDDAGFTYGGTVAA